MPANLAKPTFVSGPSDKLATVDVYTQTSSSVINNRSDILNRINFSATSSPFGASGMISALPLGGTKNLLQTGIKSITDRLNISNPTVAKIVGSLGKGLAGVIEKRLPGTMVGTIIGTGNAIIGTINMAKSGNIMGTIGAVNALADLAGVPGLKIADPKGLTATAIGIAQQGIQSGVPGIMGTLVQAGAIQGQAAINQAVKELMPTITGTGNLSAFKELSVVAGKSMLNAGSDALGNFAKAYPAPTPAISIAQYQTNFTEIKDVFSSVTPDWNSAMFKVADGSTETAVDLSSITNGSTEFRKTITIGALNSDEPEDKWLLLGDDPYEDEDGNVVTPRSVTAEEKKALDGITVTYETQQTSTMPSESDPDYIAWLKANPAEAYSKNSLWNYMEWKKKQDKPKTMAELYPAMAEMPKMQVAPTDPRTVENVEKVQDARASTNPVILPSKTKGQLELELESLLQRQADAISSETAVLESEAKAAKDANDLATYRLKIDLIRIRTDQINNLYKRLASTIRANIKIWEDHEKQSS